MPVNTPGADADPDEDALVEEFQTWLASNTRSEWRDIERHRPFDERARASRDWEAALGRAGWLGLTIPTEYGGRGMSMKGAALIAAKLAEAGAPELFNTVGLDTVAPALVRYGTEEQKRRFLPAILAGQLWCQGFSEPDSGSDLASLKTRAEWQEDRFIVNGQKVWSSFASVADYCILLARTDPEAPKHRGISCFLMPMSAPGLDVVPIRQITGDAEFFELFLKDCELTPEDLLGPPGAGWRITMDVLSHERNSMFTLLGTVHRDLEGLLDLIRSLPADAIGRAELESRAVDAFVRETIVQWSNQRATECMAAGQPDVRLDSTMKLTWSELHQEMAKIAIAAVGPFGLVEAHDPSALDEGRWLFTYLHSRAETIYAGTSEIHRNIIAERVLGLPRDQRA
ncbi:MAG: acyl-CoA dehydrogenase family protein [Actinomycetota bacterium]